MTGWSSGSRASPAGSTGPSALPPAGPFAGKRMNCFKLGLNACHLPRWRQRVPTELIIGYFSGKRRRHSWAEAWCNYQRCPRSPVMIHDVQDILWFPPMHLFTGQVRKLGKQHYILLTTLGLLYYPWIYCAFYSFSQGLLDSQPNSDATFLNDLSDSALVPGICKSFE